MAVTGSGLHRAPAWGFALLALTAVVAFARGSGAASGDEAGAAARDRRALGRIQAPPLGLPPVPIPAENPPTAEKIALGRKLFFDRRLSVNTTMSCAMCHIPEQGFTNNELARPLGVEGQSLRRNAPSVLNSAYVVHVFHDGRRPSLEAQALDPLVHPQEMANPDLKAVVARIGNLSDYDGLFERAFGTGPSPERIGRAVASWERTLLSGDSPFDRWRYGGESGALTPEQLRGFMLFTGDAGCVRCHPIGEEHALFTDNRFHDTGIGYRAGEVAPRDTARVTVEIAPGVSVPMSREAIRSVGNPPEQDLGRFEVTGDRRDRWRYKTPSLRNVVLTAPYMHDGSFATLAAVVRFYVRGGIPHDGLDPALGPLDLEDDDVAALVAFLESLTGSGIADLVEDARSEAAGN